MKTKTANYEHYFIKKRNRINFCDDIYYNTFFEKV